MEIAQSRKYILLCPVVRGKMNFLTPLKKQKYIPLLGKPSLWKMWITANFGLS